jgi:hypothetical protein
MASLLPATWLEDRSDHPSTQHSLTSLRPGARSADLKMTGASSAYHAYPDLQLASLHPIYSVSLVDPSARLYTATSKVDPPLQRRCAFGCVVSPDTPKDLGEGDVIPRPSPSPLPAAHNRWVPTRDVRLHFATAAMTTKIGGQLRSRRMRRQGRTRGLIAKAFTVGNEKLRR